jgi:hypothetical protein
MSRSRKILTPEQKEKRHAYMLEYMRRYRNQPEGKAKISQRKAELKAEREITGEVPTPRPRIKRIDRTLYLPAHLLPNAPANQPSQPVDEAVEPIASSPSLQPAPGVARVPARKIFVVRKPEAK